MNILKLLTTQIRDLYTQENFIRLNTYFRDSTQWLGFQHRVITLTASGTQKVPHKLPFTPKDLVVTSDSGPGVVAWNYTEFDDVNLSLTITGDAPSKTTPKVLRLYLGTHVEGDL